MEELAWTIVKGSQHSRDCAGEHERWGCGVCEYGQFGPVCITCGRGGRRNGMTLAVGNHVAKLKQDWSTPEGKIVEPPTLQENESYVEFEVLALTGQQGDESGFTAILKKVK